MGVPFLLLPSIRNFSVHASDNRGASWKRGRTGSSSKDLGVPGQRLENVSANILMSVSHPKSNIGSGITLQFPITLINYLFILPTNGRT